MLHAAFTLWLACAAADTTTTYHALQASPLVQEANPVLAPLRDHPAWLTAALAGENAAVGTIIWRRVRPHHPRVAVALYLGLAAFDGWLAGHNLHTAQAR